MTNEVEAGKIRRMNKELSESLDLTSVIDDSTMFEAATNSHFNRRMNEIVLLENSANQKISSPAAANRAIESINDMLSGPSSPAQFRIAERS